MAGVFSMGLAGVAARRVRAAGDAAWRGFANMPDIGSTFQPARRQVKSMHKSGRACVAAIAPGRDRGHAAMTGGTADPVAGTAQAVGAIDAIHPRPADDLAGGIEHAGGETRLRTPSMRCRALPWSGSATSTRQDHPGKCSLATFDAASN